MKLRSSAGVKDVELREWIDEAGECPIALGQSCVGEECDGACQAKDCDVVGVVPEDVVRLLLDHIRLIHRLASVLFVPADVVCDGPFVHRWTALLFDLHRAHTRMVQRVNFDRFNVN